MKGLSPSAPVPLVLSQQLWAVFDLGVRGYLIYVIRSHCVERKRSYGNELGRSGYIQRFHEHQIVKSSAVYCI
ncbi:hypothetical protein BOTBODRAFT_32199 [Botryobasidium botryosum FD-172 SS1]|uniref:Uncharacterized protein n=1 Tax=Botryobasidium botryosum (strain FD-172 SS1) TaxID=930990 RepID=A0A067MSP8_BOTB1|nr:hypothetical protein BOTBODRAFT_32199 [Botryobasidium botryosum FD-172 SS1]